MVNMKTSAVQDPPTITIAVYAGIEKLDFDETVAMNIEVTA